MKEPMIELMKELIKATIIQRLTDYHFDEESCG